MYAETDFILALVKESDWLKNNAESIYEKYNDEIWGSQILLQELMLYSYKNKLDTVTIIEETVNLIKIKNISINYEYIIASSHIMSNYKASPFDSMHAVLARQDGVIISSDSVYDKIGLKRIKLEEKI